MKVKLASRATITDVLKLEEMLVGVSDVGFAEVHRIMAIKT